MTLLIGAMTAEGPMLATDSLRMRRDGIIQPAVAKLTWYPPYLVASNGDVADHTHYFAELPPHAKLDSPAFHLEHVGRMRRNLQWYSLEGEQPLELEFTLMIADASHIVLATAGGNLQEVRNWQVVGCGDEVATYLMHQGWKPGLTAREFVLLAAQVITEVAKVSVYVAPPVWIGTPASGGIGEVQA